jgi:hypothetical protein
MLRNHLSTTVKNIRFDYFSYLCITHLLQLLDVGVFQNLKYNFKKVVKKEIFNSTTNISKVDFFLFF